MHHPKLLFILFVIIIYPFHALWEYFRLFKVLLCMFAKLPQSCPTPCKPMDWATRFLCPWGSLGKNTGVGCPALLQGIFPTPELNLYLLHLPALAGRFFIISDTWETLKVLLPAALFSADGLGPWFLFIAASTAYSQPLFSMWPRPWQEVSRCVILAVRCYHILWKGHSVFT